MIVDLDGLREAYWEEIVEFMESLKPNIESMYSALDLEDEEILSDQMSIVLTKFLEGYSKMTVLGILDSIGKPDL